MRNAESVMGKRFYGTHGRRLRDAFVVLTLVSHLIVTLGIPLPAASRKSKDASNPFPCQSRPCGCLTAEQCWKGDCCCFRIEEKLKWADANGFEPPDHVRPLVESRKFRPASSKKRRAAPDDEHASESAMATCCEKRKPAAASLCINTPVRIAEKEPTPDDGPGVRWVVGIFAQKCRGETSSGSIGPEPAVVCNLTPVFIAGLERGRRVAARSEWSTSLTHTPPTRPPRSS